MTVLALALFAVLTTIAATHFYWAFGGFWPGKDETSLARTVIGVKNISRMPSRALTLIVATAIFVAALWPLIWQSLIPWFLPPGLIWLGMVALILVFAGRGIFGYLPVFQKSNCEQPFARLNKLYFSPLCLLMGAGFANLFFNV